MAKRTFAFVAVFAALLSVTLSVQAEVMDYYWVGGGANNNYWTNTNWRIGSTTGETPAAGSMGVATNSITAYILNAPADIKFDYDRLGDGVVRLNLGQAGNTDTAVLNRAGQLMIQNGKTLAIGDGGTLNFNPSSSQHTLNVQSGGTLSITGGKLKYNVGTSGTSFEVESGSTMTVSGGTLESDAPMNVAGTMTVSGGTFTVTNNITVPTGGSFTYSAGDWDYANTLSVTGGTFTYNKSGSKFQTSNAMSVSAGSFTVQAANSFRIGQSADATITISGGEFTSNAPTYVGINPYNGTITQSAGSATFNNELSIGWGSNTSGTYNLSGGTLTTTGKAGLCNYGASKVNTFNMTGGTANFNKTGESFTIGLDSTAATANAFNLYSGTVNATDTFAVKYNGTLFVAKNGETGGNGVLNAKGIALTNNGHLNMSSGTINVGSGGITSSDGSYSIALSGGTLGTNGASWSSALTAMLAADSTTTFSPGEGETITWSGVLSGSGGVTKTGAGTLTLSGVNTYSGGTTISAGTLAISNANGLGTGAVTINGGTLDTSAAVMNVANSFVVGENGGTITAKSGSYSSFASISGSGDLTTNGYVHFNGAGGYNGHLTVNSGYTRINPSSFGVFDLTLKSGSQFAVLESGTIQIGKLNAPNGSTYLFGANGDLEYTFKIGVGTVSTDTATYGCAIRGGNNTPKVTIQKVGKGTQTFNRSGWGFCSSGNNNSIKAVIVDDGKMIIDANNTDAYKGGNTMGYWGYAPITVNSGATLEYVRAWTTSPNVLMTVNGGTLTLDTVQYQNKMVLNSATINGAGNLQVGHRGNGEWTVTGGTSTINNNFLIVKSVDGNTTYNATFTINFDAGATLDIKKGMSGMSGYTGTNVIFKGTGNAPGNIIIEAQSGDMSGLGNLTFDNMNGSIAAVYSGTGSLTKSGAGTLVLTAGNTYTGTTTISAGTLKLSAADAISSSGSVVNNAAITMEAAQTINNLEGSGTIDNGGYLLTLNNSADTAYSGVISGSGGLTKTGDKKLTLSGANTYTGKTTISAGTLEVNNNFTSSSGLAGSGTLKLSGDKKYFDIGDASEFTGTVQVFGTGISAQSRVYLAGANGTTSTNINLSNATVEINGNTSGKFSELTFSKGGSTLTVGTLNGNKCGRIINLDSSSDAAYNNLTVSSGTFAGQIGREDASGSSYAYVNKINLNKVGDGTFTFSGIPYYFGETNIQGGVLKFVNDNTSGNKLFNRSNALKGSGTLQVVGNTDNWVLFAINANASSPQEFSGLLDVSGNFAFYQNANLGNATLHVAKDSYATMHGGNTKNLTVKELNTEAGSKVRISHASPGDGNFATLTVGSGTVNGDLGETANNAYYNWVKLNKVNDGSEDGGRLTLAGAFLYTGETTVSGGVLELTGDAVSANGPMTVWDNGTLIYNLAEGQSKLLTIDNSNKIVSTGAVEKTGDGTLQIYAASAGQVDASHFLVSSGRLDMKEYFEGTLEVGKELDEGYTTATFSPGNSVGSLTIDGFFTLNPGSTLLMEIGGPDPEDNDILIVNGDITLADNSVINLVKTDDCSLGIGESFTMILTANNISDLNILDFIQSSDFTDLNYEQISYEGSTVYAITARTLNANEIPEPSTWALLALGVVVLFLRKRVRN